MRLNASTLLALGIVCLMGFLSLPNPVKAQAPAGQGSLDLTLIVKNKQGKPLANTPVEFVEVHNRTKLTLSTDEEGTLAYTFKEGRYWQINIKDIKDYFYWQFEVKPNRNGHRRRTITYNYKHYLRVTRPPVDRSQLALKKVNTKDNEGTRADETHGIVRLSIKRPGGQPLGNYKLSLTCYKLGTIFNGKTNVAGNAYFKVPMNNEYEIDIDGIESYQYVDLPNRPRYTATKRFQYEPTLIKEVVVNDTITQDLPAGQKGTSDRVLSTITLKGGPNGVWRNEHVYVQELKGKLCYRGTTDTEGKVRFLLPKGKQFMIHARFEKDLDVLDYRRSRGVGYNNKTVLYRPLEKYQFPDKYIPKPEDLITTAFQNFLEKQYPRPEEGKAIRTMANFTGALSPESKEAVLRLAFTTPQEGNIKYAPKLNLAFVIDKSGSMAGEDRIEELKRSLETFLKKLRPTDQISLITFEDFEKVDIPSQPLNIDRALEVVRRLEAGGGTNIYKGMMAGYKEVAKGFRRGSANRVIILSDGYGVTPVEEILAAQKPFTAKGIECSTVGVGAAYNYSLLKLMATKGGGMVEHVGDAKGLQSAFQNQLASVMFPVARNVKFEVIFPQGLEYKQLYGHELTAKSGNRLTVRLKNFYAGLDEIAFIRFLVPHPTKELCDKPVTVRISYTDVITNQKVVEETKVNLEWQEYTGETELVMEQNEKKMYAAAIMNQSLKVMSDKFHCNDLGAARDALADGMDQMKRVYPNATDRDLLALRTQLEDYLDIISKQLDSL